MVAVVNAEKEGVASYQKADTFGPRVKSVITALSGFYKNSEREIANIMKDIFNLNISIGSISNSEAMVASKCKEAYERVERASKVLHIDETSHYTKGKLGWCWMFANNKAKVSRYKRNEIFKE